MWLAFKAAYKAFGQAYRAAFIAFSVTYSASESKKMWKDITHIWK